MTKTALITGGTGFLGTNLAARLADEGWRVHITTRNQQKSVRSDIKVHVCDMVDPVRTRHVIDAVKPHYVYHLAGAVSARPDLDLADITFHSHVTSAHNLLVLAAQGHIERLILCGSMMEMLDEIPSSPYAAAKAVTRLYGEMFHAIWQAPVVVARPFMTFGPGQARDKVLPYVIRSLDNGDAPRLSGGTWRADWIYVADVVEAFFLSAVKPGIDGAVLDFGRGELVTLREMAETIAGLMKSDVPLVFGAHEDRPNEPVRMADVAATTALLGWTPVVDLKDGLARTIASYTRS